MVANTSITGWSPVLALDLDGTVIDNSARHHWAYAKALASLGYAAMPRDEYWSLKRQAIAVPAILGRSTLNANCYLEFRQRWMDLIESDDGLEMDCLQPGSEAALERLALSFRLVLVTLRRSRTGLERQLQRLSLRDRFESVVSGAANDGIGNVKAGLLAEARRQYAPMAYVADTEVDVAAARAEGMLAVAVTCGIRDRTILLGSNPDAICESLEHASNVLPRLLADRGIERSNK